MEGMEHLQYHETQSVVNLCPLHAGTRDAKVSTAC